MNVTNIAGWVPNRENWSVVAFCGVWSGSTLFAQTYISAYVNKYGILITSNLLTNNSEHAPDCLINIFRQIRGRTLPRILYVHWVQDITNQNEKGFLVLITLVHVHVNTLKGFSSRHIDTSCWQTVAKPVPDRTVKASRWVGEYRGGSRMISEGRGVVMERGVRFDRYRTFSTYSEW